MVHLAREMDTTRVALQHQDEFELSHCNDLVAFPEVGNQMRAERFTSATHQQQTDEACLDKVHPPTARDCLGSKCA